MGSRIGRNKKRRREERRAEAEAAKERHEQWQHEWELRNQKEVKERKELVLEQLRLSNKVLEEKNNLISRLNDMGFTCYSASLNGGLMMDVSVIRDIVQKLEKTQNTESENV